MQSIYYRTWDQFKAHFWEELRGESDALNRRDFVFRGQGSAAWPLQPSIVRFFPHENGVSRERAQVQLLQEFVRELQNAKEDVPEGPLEQWALGQHYDLPSPLLDWSNSPYVAAFFAFQSAMLTSFPGLSGEEIIASKERVSVSALRRFGHIQAGNHTFNAEIIWEQMGVKFIESVNRRNNRIRAQLGLFTLLPPDFDTLESLVETFCQDRSIKPVQILTKFSIPYSATIDAITDLMLMDITPRRIYGDLIGATRAAALRMRLNYYDRT